jgi:hypothetical protein
MKRLGVLIALLVALLWQSAALARSGAPSPLLADLEHAMLHWGDEGHHHHDDGSFHLDTSDESTLHVMTDHVNGSALLRDTAQALPSFRGSPPGRDVAAAAPPPFLDGLLRPPRTTA